MPTLPTLGPDVCMNVMLHHYSSSVPEPLTVQSMNVVCHYIAVKEKIHYTMLSTIPKL